MVNFSIRYLHFNYNTEYFTYLFVAQSLELAQHRYAMYTHRASGVDLPVLPIYRCVSAFAF